MKSIPTPKPTKPVKAPGEGQLNPIIKKIIVSPGHQEPLETAKKLVANRKKLKP